MKTWQASARWVLGWVALSAWLEAGATIYSGNGNGGFGGPVGQGTLAITSDETNLYFTLNRGPAPLNDYLVLYLDTLPGGHGDTLGFFDDADFNRRAISGFDGSSQAAIVFPGGSEPDWGIGFSAAGGAFLYGLQDGGPGAHSFFAVGGGAGASNAPSFTWSFPRATLGLSTGDTFRFYGTLINGFNAFRSDEAFGPGIGSGNPGIPSGVTFMSPLTYRFGATAFERINYQGRLVISNELANGSYTLAFQLYDAATGGTALYGETQTVDIVDGLYAVQLGAATPESNPLPQAIAETPAFLEVVVNGQPLSPREPMSAVAYAMMSAAVVQDGITAEMIQNGAVTAGKLGGSAVTADKIAPNAVTSSALDSGAVTAGKLGVAAVTVGTIANGAVTASTLASNAVSTATIADGTITVQDVAANTFWSATGNAGTVSGTHFVGTSDNQPLELRVNSQRAVLIQPTNGAPNVVMGAANNVISSGTWGASILGGSNNTIGAEAQHGVLVGGQANSLGPNAAHSVIGGGFDNHVRDNSQVAIIAGGSFNEIGTNSSGSVIGGGRENGVANNIQLATIAGGWMNNIGTNSSYSVIGGGRDNNVANQSLYATIAGGFFNDIGTNSANAAIGGGRNNDVADNSPYATIAGGNLNRIRANADWSAIGGGLDNQILSNSASAYISGGESNVIGPAAANAVILGGAGNRISTNAARSVILGGAGNLIGPGAVHALAAGQSAQALHQGSFVWADDQAGIFSSTASNQFLIRAGGGVGIGTNNPAFPLHVFSTAQILQELRGNNTGGTWFNLVNGSVSGRSWSVITTASGNGEGPGHLLIRDNTANAVRMMVRTNGFVGFGTTTPTNPLQMASGAYVSAGGTWTSVSDKNRKENFETVDPQEILDKVAALPIATWNYTAEPGVRHIGPTAQDFHAAFGVGPGETAIAQIDPDGVALAAIQALANENAEFRVQNAEMKRENEALRAEIEAIKARLGM